jgi:hypothetical protein
MLAALEGRPFSSARELGRATQIPRAAVSRRLTKPLGFVGPLLCWVPQPLPDAQKVRRVQSSWRLLWMLEPQEQRAWREVVTLYESWFHCSPDYESIWLSPGARVFEMPHVTIPCKQLMVAIVWKSSGFHLMRVLSSNCKFNSSCYRREILEPFSEWRREPSGRTGRILIVHADNTRPHTQRQHHKNLWRRTD